MPKRHECTASALSLPSRVSPPTIRGEEAGKFPLPVSSAALQPSSSADVAGYSRLMGRDESGTLAALKALRREVVDPAIAKHGGRIVKTTGDGLLLEFASVVDAVRCAVEVQTAMADAQLADVPRIAASPSASASTSATSSSRATTSSATASTSPPASQGSREPGGICVSSRGMRRCATGSTSPSRMAARRRSRTSLDPSRSRRWQPARR